MISSLKSILRQQNGEGNNNKEEEEGQQERRLRGSLRFSDGKSSVCTPFYFVDENQDPIEVCLSECMVKGTNTSELIEYTICGVFRDGQFSLEAMPYVISSEVLEEIVDQLSASTKDEMNDFRETYLGGPPELEELFKVRPVVFL